MNYSNDSWRKRWAPSIAILSVVFLIMLVLNYWTPLIYDDYRYHLETKGFSTIFSDEFHQYMTWTGRSVAHVILRFFLRFPKLIFDIASAGVFVFLTWMATRVALVDKKVGRWRLASLIIWIVSLLWMFTPQFAEVFFWMSGSANYSFVMVIMFSFIAIYHFAVIRSHTDRSIWFSILMLFFGILAGWCNENTSGGVLLIVCGYTVLQYFVKHEKVPAWMYTGILGNIVGLGIMLAAPGNAIRAAYFPARTNLSPIWKIIEGSMQLFPSLATKAGTFLVIAVFLLVFSIFSNGYRMQEMISTLFLVAGLATILVLLMAPVALVWGRSYFGGIFFIIVSIASSTVSLLDQRDQAVHLALSLIASYVMVNAFCLFVPGIADSYQNHMSYQNQLSSLIHQRDAGDKDVVVPKLQYTAVTKYSITNRDDISSHKDNYRNKQTAAYWHVNSVKVKK